MKINIREIDGNWDLGFALDKHVLSSQYIGENEYGHAQFDTKRSEAGEALYQLKYNGDFSQAHLLAKAIAKEICPRFKNIGLIVPVPPSKIRRRQPVIELASELGKLIGVGSFDNIILKSGNNDQLKDLNSKEEKVNALKGILSVNDGINGDGKWNALIVDDLYDTGASLEATCAKLREYNKINKVYVATATWK